MNRKVILTFLLFVSAGLASAQSRTRSATAHMRPQLFHDRAPHVHNRDAQVKRHGA